MIATLVNHDELRTSYLVVVIQPDNLKRMRKADPVTLETVAMHGILPVAKYPDRLAVLIAYEEDEEEVYRVATSGSFAEMSKYLTRGYKFLRDDDGTERAFSLNRGREAEKPKP
jgi:hypothetical protein